MGRVKTVVVLGMHRSGTSLIAGILQKLGVDMGKKQLGPHFSNPLGHFENIDFIKMDDKILAHAGGEWDNPPSIKKIEKLNSEKLKQKIRKTISKNQNTLWGWKVPTTSLTILHYMPYLKNPYFILCERDEQKIIDSFVNRDGLSEKRVKKMTEVYNKALQHFLLNNKYPILHLKYEELIRNPGKEIGKISGFLGIPENKKKIDDAKRLILPKDELNRLKEKIRKKEILLLIKDTLRFPYLARRYFLRALRKPLYTLKKLGIKK